MQVYQNLTIELEDGIAIVTINRPKALNALNSKTMEELLDFFLLQVHEIKPLGGIIITGAGDRAFVAGADINDFLDLNPQNMEHFVRRGHQIFNAIERFTKPVVAAIHGFALGGGCELAMACHLRVATEVSKFGQPEVNLGLLPGYGGTQRLIQLVGKAKALELMLTGDLLDAAGALRHGLINTMVAVGEEINAAKSLIRKISQKAPLAVTAVIDAVNAYYDPQRDGFEVEIAAFTRLSGTQDFKEGARAFLEKRKPEFHGS